MHWIEQFLAASEAGQLALIEGRPRPEDEAKPLPRLKAKALANRLAAMASSTKRPVSAKVMRKLYEIFDAHGYEGLDSDDLFAASPEVLAQIQEEWRQIAGNPREERLRQKKMRQDHAEVQAEVSSLIIDDLLSGAATLNSLTPAELVRVPSAITLRMQIDPSQALIDLELLVRQTTEKDA